jgi:hypothetical protein
MPRPRSGAPTLDIKHLARLGAQARLTELQAERRALLAAFPQLADRRAARPKSAPRRATAGAQKAPAATPEPAAAADAPKSRRGQISAAGRRRIAEAARKRWAAWRRKQKRS